MGSWPRVTGFHETAHGCFIAVLWVTAKPGSQLQGQGVTSPEGCQHATWTFPGCQTPWVQGHCSFFSFSCSKSLWDLSTGCPWLIIWEHFYLPFRILFAPRLGSYSRALCNRTILGLREGVRDLRNTSQMSVLSFRNAFVSWQTENEAALVNKTHAFRVIT